jgi:hypothetical protein
MEADSGWRLAVSKAEVICDSRIAGGQSVARRAALARAYSLQPTAEENR